MSSTLRVSSSYRRLARIVGLVGLLACAARPTPEEASSACDALCVDGGFRGGTARSYGNGLDTCVCAGLGEGIAESACVDYCRAFGVEAPGAQLTTDADDDDTCTCNATP